MTRPPRRSGPLAALAEHLAQRRGEILRTWRLAIRSDPSVVAAANVTRSQLDDHIPDVLEALEHRLRANETGDRHEKAEARQEQRESAAEHGLHRWLQGYNERETMREWAHLQLCLMDELEHYSRTHPQHDADAMHTARRVVVTLCAEGIAESAARYASQQKREAAGRVRELERALAQLQALVRDRAEAWREAAHDLRGNVGLIANASALLARMGASDAEQASVSEILCKSAISLRALLNDLMSLARLEAGHEQRHLAEVDVAAILREFGEALRPIAAERGLFLRLDGPEELRVEGDEVKIRRIAQNLALNALDAAREGGVTVVWMDERPLGSPQWALSIEDTGPGFQAPAAAALSRAGEGVGLSIVKRLCDLLEAHITFESAPDKGTRVTATFPTSYPVAAPTTGRS